MAEYKGGEQNSQSETENAENLKLYKLIADIC